MAGPGWVRAGLGGGKFGFGWGGVDWTSLLIMQERMRDWIMHVVDQVVDQVVASSRLCWSILVSPIACRAPVSVHERGALLQRS